MDTITNRVLQSAAEHVTQNQHLFDPIWTVVVTLNGAHGGADVIIEGQDYEGNVKAITKEVH